MSLRYLFDPNKQFQDRNGVNNVAGILRVYIDGTDDRATTYKDFNGTMNEADITLDTDGRAVVIVDDSFTFRLEVYSRDGSMLWTVTNFTARGEGGGGGSSTPVVVDGTANEIDVTESMTAGVKYYTIGLAKAVKNILLGFLASLNNLVGILSSKADKVQGATAGNLAALDASGNLTDSGSKAADFKTKQTPVTDPSASGAGLEFIDSVSQNANGEITPHKKSVQDGTTAQKGVVKLSNAIDSTSVTEAATPKAVKDAYDELNNKIVARAVFLSQAEWAVQIQLPGDPAKVYYVENGTGEDAYTVYVWKESTSEYVEVDESSIDLDGYWHDGPTTTGSGNVVTNITLGNDGVPQVEKGLTALTQHQSVTDNDPTLAWGTRSKVGTIGSTELHVTMPSNPASGKLDSTGDASNTTSTFTKASGDTSSMASGGKLSAIFTAISSFFASLKALAFKDKVSDSDINGTISDSHIASASTWNGKQNSLGINSASGDTGKFLNERGAFATPNYPSVPSVINNLTSTSTTDALSAAQGKTLNDAITKVPLFGSVSFTTFIGYEQAFGVDFNGLEDGGNIEVAATCTHIMYSYGVVAEYQVIINIKRQGDTYYFNADYITKYKAREQIHLGLQVRQNTSSKYLFLYVTANSIPNYESMLVRIDRATNWNGQNVSPNIITIFNLSAIEGTPSWGTVVSGGNNFNLVRSVGGVGSTSQPVYVDSNGQVQPCDPSQMNVGSASTAVDADYAVTSKVMVDAGGAYVNQGGYNVPVYFKDGSPVPCTTIPHVLNGVFEKSSGSAQTFTHNLARLDGASTSPLSFQFWVYNLNNQVVVRVYTNLGGAKNSQYVGQPIKGVVSITCRDQYQGVGNELTVEDVDIASLGSTTAGSNTYSDIFAYTLRSDHKYDCMINGLLKVGNIGGRAFMWKFDITAQKPSSSTSVTFIVRSEAKVDWVYDN